jgi:putative transposase
MNLARWLDRVAPAAARSLREGLEETLTVASLKLPAKLARCLCSTNIIESPFDRVRSITRRITRWTGQMRIRWCVTALVEAEQRFIRISGADSADKLTTALDALRHSSELKTA